MDMNSRGGASAATNATGRDMTTLRGQSGFSPLDEALVLVQAYTKRSAP